MDKVAPEFSVYMWKKIYDAILKNKDNSKQNTLIHCGFAMKIVKRDGEKFFHITNLAEDIVEIAQIKSFTMTNEKYYDELATNVFGRDNKYLMF